MPLLDIPATTSTPRILFDPTSSCLLMSGESYPENSFLFYAPVFAWLKDYFTTGQALSLSIRITYMNSSSTKCMLDLLDLFEEAYREGKNVVIVWSYDPENSRSLDLAEEFREEVSLPFSIVASDE